MNREQAEGYVEYGINYMDFSKKICYRLLPLILFVLTIAIALHRELIFMAIVVIIALLSIVFSIVFLIKYSIFNGFMSVGLQLLFTNIALNLIVFGINKLTKSFILWEYIVSIVIQVIAFGVSWFLIKRRSEKFKLEENYTKTEIVAGTMAGFSCALALILCRIFAPPLTTVVSIIVILINFIVCLINVGIIMAFYRAYLIKKFNLDF